MKIIDPEKIKRIKQYLIEEKTTRLIQELLKKEFDSGVNNNLIKKKRDELTNKITNKITVIPKLNQTFIQKQFDYNEKTGHLTKKKNNMIFNTPNKNGYISIVINGKDYYAHHLVWLHYYGRLPKLIHHKNQNRADNRIENLEEMKDNNEHSQKHKEIKKTLDLRDLTDEFQLYLVGLDAEKYTSNRKAIISRTQKFKRPSLIDGTVILMAQFLKVKKLKVMEE